MMNNNERNKRAELEVIISKEVLELNKEKFEYILIVSYTEI